MSHAASASSVRSTSCYGHVRLERGAKHADEATSSWAGAGVDKLDADELVELLLVLVGGDLQQPGNVAEALVEGGPVVLDGPGWWGVDSCRTYPGFDAGECLHSPCRSAALATSMG